MVGGRARKRRGGLRPESWRSDLLDVVLRALSVFGAVVCIPSVVMAVKADKLGVVVLDACALVLVLGLTIVNRLPQLTRAILTCVVFYIVGTGLMIGVGTIGQTYLLGFSIMTTLLVSRRWGHATVVLNGVTMVVTGYLGIAKPAMFGRAWTEGITGWLVVTANFLFVNASLLIAVGAVIQAIERALDRSVKARAALEREQTELVEVNTSLRDNKALLKIAGRMARLGGWRVDLATSTFLWSEEVCDLFEVPHGSTPTVQTVLDYCTPASRLVAEANFTRLLREGTPLDIVKEIVTPTGKHIWMRSVGSVQRDEAGTITHGYGYIQDVSAQKAAEAKHDAFEEHIRQAQKMETIGSLAGGVAHDMNNLMSVVVSYSEILADELPVDDPARADLLEIHAAGRRATALTRQLLAFSRQQVLAPKVIDLAEIVGGMEKMLRRLIGEDVEMATICAAGGGKVLVDPGQIEQVVMNLAVNARDAMPTGGRITIETSDVVLDESDVADLEGAVPGPHVRLAVRDTGVGMDRATQARMFEPFFTTKEQGKGTGLGLATVFGVVRQSGGTIAVDSEPGKGTTFEVYFPLAEGTVSVRSDIPSSERSTLRGKETVLLVEDEEGVRVLARTILQKFGYHVLEAQNPGDALLLCEQHASSIDLLLTDVVMPRTSGRKLAERLLLLRPGMKVLFMSGYTDDAVVRHGIQDSTIAFLQKPITPDLLARKVREVLDAKDRSAAFEPRVASS